MKKPKTVLIGHELQVAFFDANGEQVAEMQKECLLTLLCEKAERLGYDMNGQVVETRSGNFIMKRCAGPWKWQSL